VIVDTNGTLFGGAWLDAKEMWSGGWKSLVAILTTNGSDSSWLRIGTIARPSFTASDPV